MNESFLAKSFFALGKLIQHPQISLSCIRYRFLHGDPYKKDRILAQQTSWLRGTLPRMPLTRLLPGVEQVDVSLPRALDRRFGWSVTLEEAGCLGAVIRHLKARKVLEIGTYDGNTALVMAANLPGEGEVVTVDLPPNFDQQQMAALPGTEGFINLTPRETLGRQFRDHPLRNRIRQIYGDSAALDWTTLGGPFDLIFIDGCHSETYVLSDSRHAFSHLARGGAIVWHDYGMLEEVSWAIERVAREVKELKICIIEGTRLAIGLKE